MDDKVVCNNMFEEINIPVKAHSIKQIKEDPSAYSNNLNVKRSNVATSNERYPAMPKTRRGRRNKKLLDTKSQSAVSKLKCPTLPELKLGLKYRPIRPKPAPSLISKKKLFQVSPTVNKSILNSSNRPLATASMADKNKIRDVTIVSDTSDGKTINYIKHIINSNIGSIATVTKDINDRNMTGYSGKATANKKESCNSKVSNKSKNSIELFFESMAQTVMNLPTQVQAEIKMEICKLVTMAEIKYYGSKLKRRTDSI